MWFVLRGLVAVSGLERVYGEFMRDDESACLRVLLEEEKGFGRMLRRIRLLAGDPF